MVIAIGFTTMVVGGWRALQQRDLKLLLAHGTVSQLGFLFLLLGAEPHCHWLPDEVARDRRGFVLTGREVPRERWLEDLPPPNLATSVPGIFAAGDVRAGSMKRVAAATGEGASVVPLVHAFLAPEPG